MKIICWERGFSYCKRSSMYHYFQSLVSLIFSSFNYWFLGKDHLTTRKWKQGLPIHLHTVGKGWDNWYRKQTQVFEHLFNKNWAGPSQLSWYFWTPSLISVYWSRMIQHINCGLYITLWLWTHDLSHAHLQVDAVWFIVIK